MLKYVDKSPFNSFLLEITPTELRKIADRLDAQLKLAYPGQTILLPITETHTICMTASLNMEGKLIDKH
jgi:hypothetical protein